MPAIVAPPGDCSMVRTRDCFEPELAFLPLALAVLACEAAAVMAAAFVGAESFFADFDMEILRSVGRGSHRTTEAPHQPSGQRGRISGRTLGAQVGTLPLQSRANASPFWITFLLRWGTSEHGTSEHPMLALPVCPSRLRAAFSFSGGHQWRLRPTMTRPDCSRSCAGKATTVDTTPFGVT